MDWKRKLTSRKLWVSIASFVSLLIVAFGMSEQSAAQMSAIIMAGATVIAYVVGEGLVDTARVENTENVTYQYVEPIDKEKEEPVEEDSEYFDEEEAKFATDETEEYYSAEEKEEP